MRRRRRDDGDRQINNIASKIQKFKNRGAGSAAIFDFLNLASYIVILFVGRRRRSVGRSGRRRRRRRISSKFKKSKIAARGAPRFLIF